MNLKHIDWYLENNARNYPDKLAVVYDDEQLTWGELWRYTVESARVFAERLGVGEQKVVAVLLDNSIEFIRVYLAVLRAGHVILPLDPNYKRIELDAIVEQIQPAMIITDISHAELFASSVNVGHILEVQSACEERLELSSDEQVATMLFTSGTTGSPKVTQYSHLNHMWNIYAVSDLWKWNCEDTLLLSLPLSHWHGLVMVLGGGIYHGNTIFLQKRFNVIDTLEVLHSGKISMFMHVPLAYSKLVEFADYDKYDLSRVRLFVSGSSYLPPRIWHDFKNMYGQEILERYGSSETGLIASNRLDSREAGSVGFVLPDVVVRRADDGELAMKSPGLFVGYYKNSEATNANYTSDGLWLTGDIGDIADDGRIVLKGRIQEKMKKLGYTVYARDVEWALMKMGGLSDVVAVGVPVGDELSDRIVCFVVGDVSEDQIRDYAKENMPSAWRPDKIVFLDEIPRTRSGKPVRKKLLELAQN